MSKKQGQALVVGGGISGIRSALDLAEAGCGVTLIDSAPHMGGMLSKLEHQFPTDGCGMCRMLPAMDRDSCFQGCLRKGLIHENIDIKLLTQLVNIEGEPGKYKVTLETEPVIIDPDLCTGCNKCSEVCPVIIPDPFNNGLSSTRAVYLPVPHSIPNIYTIDMDHCTLCGECENACPFGAITLPADDRKKFQILVVDDELILRESLKDWLELEGYGVATASSGQEALELLEKTPFSMMFIDIKMPGMEGTEVLSRAKENFPDLVAVMMTAYATVETAVDTMKSGALEYVIKPFDPEKIIGLVKKIFLEQRPDHRTRVELDVGAVILATGVDYYNPASGINTFGYKKLADVITNSELERILSQTGPFRGKLKRPSDNRSPRRMAWIQCVGSREMSFPVCASICCMIALKEAVLIRQRSRGTVETVIYFMDMRCFGKSFEAYRNRAEKEYGVILKRARPHSVVLDKTTGCLSLYITCDSGTRQDELFDMVVLSPGQRPGKGVDELSGITGISLNEFGFMDLPFFQDKNKTGVFVAGSASGLKGIGESVIYSSSASNMALKVIRSADSMGAGGFTGADKGSAEKESPIALRDVSREIPAMGVVICQCPGFSNSEFSNPALSNMDSSAIEHEITSIVQQDIHVARVMKKDRICTQKGWNELLDLVSETKLNRLLVVACDPDFFISKKNEISRAMGLDPAYIEFIDIHKGQPLGPMVSMGLARLRHLDRINIKPAALVPRVLVVGGGIGGMNAALGVAGAGFEAVLVEKSSKLGGNLLWLDKNINGDDFGELLKNTCEDVEKTPGITVYTNAEIQDSKGGPGRYLTTIKTRDGDLKTVLHGAVILATGGQEARTISHGYGKTDAVMTNKEFEQALKQEKIDTGNMKAVVMIQCVDSRIDSRQYCSRICCKSSLKHALELKRLNPDLGIYVLYREIMSYGFSESYFKEARELGVIFIRYTLDQKPEIVFEQDPSSESGQATVRVYEPILEKTVDIAADLVILATGIVPSGLEPLANLFHARVDKYSFFNEADDKWRPVDSIKGGVFACGLALGPRDVEESAASARAAAMGAVRLISKRKGSASLVTAGVKQSLCILCERCIDACVFGARTIDPDTNKIKVDPIACQGCGACASVCANSASYVNNFLDQQMFEIIDAAI